MRSVMGEGVIRTVSGAGISGSDHHSGPEGDTDGVSSHPSTPYLPTTCIHYSTPGSDTGQAADLDREKTLLGVNFNTTGICSHKLMAHEVLMVIQ